MIKRTLTAVAVATSVVLAVPTTAEALVPDAPNAGSPDFNGLVRSTVHRGDTIYVAGDFSSVTDSSSKTFQRDGLAAVSASTGKVLSWAPTVAGKVNRVLAAKEGVYVVGDFTSVNGRKRRDVARLDRTTGAVDSRFQHGTNGEVNAIALSRTKVFLGGDFTRFDGRDRGQLAAVDRRGVSGLRSWKPQATQGAVIDLVRKRSGVYVGGFFHHLNGTDRSFLAQVTGGKGRLIRSFKSRVPNVVLDLAVSRTRVYAGTGGAFKGGGAVSIRRKDGTRAWQRRFDGDVQAIAKMNGVVYAGGHFTSLCARGGDQQANGSCVGTPEATRFRGASLDRHGDLTAWNPNISPNVSDVPGIETFTTFKGRDGLVIGGGFSTVHGQRAARFAMFN